MAAIIATIYGLIFIYGILVGSFLNVCIYRIPKKENIVVVSSHCMSCNHKLQWYELIPLFSWIALRGKCKECKAPISIQYPIIELLNGIIWCIVFAFNGLNSDSLIYCLLASALLTLSVIDFRTYEIPAGINIFILTLGLIMTALHYTQWLDHVIGFLAVSVPICIIILATKGRGMGGGDMKLMAAAGLVLGWKLIILAFFIGCVVGSICHIARMKLSGADRVLALGPYLSIGIMIAVLFGNEFIYWYLSMIA